MSDPCWVCVANADSGSISLLWRGPDTVLQWRQTIEVGGQLMPMAHSPCGSWLHVVRRSDPWAVVTLRLDRQAGRLTVIGETALPASMAYISLDHRGRFLLAASYHDHLLSVSPVGSDGRVGPPIQRLAVGRHAHCIVVAPSNRYALAACLGADAVLRFDFDPETGLLEPANRPAWQGAAGSGPRHLRFQGERVFLLNELAATVQMLAFDGQAGQLELLHTESVLPEGFSGTPWAADLHCTPDGRFLYCSERTSSTLALFAVSEGRTALRRLGHLPTEAQPRGMALCGNDQLLVVGQRSDHLSAYRIDRQTGALELSQRLPVGRNPNWIEVIRA
jgi:6-phosphogluconolactonase